MVCFPHLYYGVIGSDPEFHSGCYWLFYFATLGLQNRTTNNTQNEIQGQNQLHHNINGENTPSLLYVILASGIVILALVLLLCQSLQEEAATLRNGIDEMRSAFDMDDREL